MAARRGVFVLLLALLSCSCILAQTSLYTLCYSDPNAPNWTAYKLDPTTGLLTNPTGIDADTSALINKTLSYGGFVGIHYHDYLHLSFTYYGGFGQGTLIRQLAANLQSSNFDLVYPTASAGGFTGDCYGSYVSSTFFLSVPLPLSFSLFLLHVKEKMYL